MLAIDCIEAETNRDQRHKKRQQTNERKRAAPREEPQKKEGILGGSLLDRTDTEADDYDCGHGYYDNQHYHEDAGEVVCNLFERHDPEAVQGRAFTPHAALLRESGSSGCRSPRGSVPPLTGAASARRPRPPPPRLPAAHPGRPRARTGWLPPARPLGRRESPRPAPPAPSPLPPPHRRHPR